MKSSEKEEQPEMTHVSLTELLLLCGSAATDDERVVELVT